MDVSTRKARLRLLIIVSVIVAIVCLLLIFGCARSYHLALGLAFVSSVIFLIVFAGAVTRGAIRGLRRDTP
jgi:hypothetical protein